MKNDNMHTGLAMPSNAGARLEAPLLELVDVAKTFGATRAVDGVSLRIAAGERVAIVGKSGAGKSTLLRLINQLVAPTSGTIHLSGQSGENLRGRRLRDWRSQCAMIFQQFNLVGRLDVQTNVLMGGLHKRALVPALMGHFPLSERIAALEALERFGMANTALQRTETLSGGQQQRVAIARAMLQRAPLVLADEPVASLDPQNTEGVMNALNLLAEDTGAAILCNLHAPDLALKHFDRIIGMAEGRVVFDRPAWETTEAEVRTVYGPG